MKLGSYRQLRRANPQPRPDEVRSVPQGVPRDLIWQGPLEGYGAMPKVSREMLKALRELGVPTTTQARRGGAANRRRAQLGAVHNRRVHLCWAPPQFLRGFRDGALRVGYTFCEATRIPRTVASQLRGIDVIAVPSAFCAEVFEQAFDSSSRRPQVAVVPHGAHATLEYAPPPQNDKTVFLSVAAPGRRKGLDVLAKGFEAAFRETKNVELWLVGEAAFPCRLPSVRRFKNVSDSELRGLYKQCHCFVLSTRGEGFCLPALEAGAAGRPSIVTSWSGHLDFVDEGTAYLVDVDRLVPRDDGGSGWGSWAEPNLDSLVHQLRTVASDHAGTAHKGRALWERVRRGWTWEDAARRLCETVGIGLPPRTDREPA